MGLSPLEDFLDLGGSALGLLGIAQVCSRPGSWPVLRLLRIGRVWSLDGPLLPWDCSGRFGLPILRGFVAGPGPGGALHCIALMDRYRGGRVDWTLATLRVPRSWILKLRIGVRWSAATPDEDFPGEFGFNYFTLRGGNYIGH